MQRQGSLAMTSPCCKSSRQMTHSPLSSVNTSSAIKMYAQSVLKTTSMIHIHKFIERKQTSYSTLKISTVIKKVGFNSCNQVTWQIYNLLLPHSGTRLDVFAICYHPLVQKVGTVFLLYIHVKKCTPTSSFISLHKIHLYIQPKKDSVKQINKDILSTECFMHPHTELQCYIIVSFNLPL